MSFIKAGWVKILLLSVGGSPSAMWKSIYFSRIIRWTYSIFSESPMPFLKVADLLLLEDSSFNEKNNLLFYVNRFHAVLHNKIDPFSPLFAMIEYSNSFTTPIAGLNNVKIKKRIYIFRSHVDLFDDQNLSWEQNDREKRMIRLDNYRLDCLVWNVRKIKDDSLIVYDKIER